MSSLHHHGSVLGGNTYILSPPKIINFLFISRSRKVFDPNYRICIICVYKKTALKTRVVFQILFQVGDPDLDHKCWDRPESMTEKRPLTQVNTSAPGTDVAAETAAAMASASLVFKTVNSTYSSMLLKHAEQLFTFADKYRALYSLSIPEVQTFYNSTGYGDELLWAASWLYHATGDQSHLDYVVQNGNKYANFGSPTWFSWDNKLAGTQVTFRFSSISKLVISLAWLTI